MKIQKGKIAKLKKPLNVKQISFDNLQKILDKSSIKEIQSIPIKDFKESLKKYNKEIKPSEYNFDEEKRRKAHEREEERKDLQQGLIKSFSNFFSFLIKAIIIIIYSVYLKIYFLIQILIYQNLN